VSVDPEGGDHQTPISLHRYLYANGSPVVLNDPTGRFGLVAAMDAVIVAGILAAIAIPTYNHFFGPKGEVCKQITIKRKNIDVFGEDKYGHWWTETILGESYGWWPKYHLPASFNGLWSTITGVEGELNGQTSFGGTQTRDPHHGDPADETFNPRLKKDSKYKNGFDAIRGIQQFAQNYSGSWSWPIGQNCHTFQEQMMFELGIEKP
jgi:hypothetical protein